VTAARQQLSPSVAVLVAEGCVCLVLAQPFAPAPVLLVLLAALQPLLPALLEGLPFLVLLLGSLALLLHAHLLHGLVGELLGVEPVDDDLGTREAFLGYSLHAVREVHRDLLHLAAQERPDAPERPDHVLHPRALDDGYECALARMAVLVGHDGVELAVT